MVGPEQESARIRVIAAIYAAQRNFMGSRRPISAILAVFGGLEIGLRCARYAGWVCIRCIYDLRRPPGYSLSPQKSVKRFFFCRQITGRSWFSVRHDAGVFMPNGRHQRNANGEKTLKPRSFGFWGGRTKKVEAKDSNRKSAKCAIAPPAIKLGAWSVRPAGIRLSGRADAALVLENLPRI